jgi:polar amino acid transport system substrate-binding protein
MVELTKVYGQLSSTYYDYFGTGVLVAMIYLLLGLPFIRIAKHFERKLNVELKQKKYIST